MSIVTIDLSRPVYISIFKNDKHVEGDNKPQLNVVIQQDKTTIIEGGAWAKEAASGLKYYNGTLQLPYAQRQQQAAAQQAPAQQAHQQQKQDGYQTQQYQQPAAQQAPAPAPASVSNLSDDIPF